MSVKFFFSSPLSNRFCFDSGFLYFNLTEIFPIVSLPANQSSTLPWRQLLSHVWLFVTPWTVACQAPLSKGILQARILEWVAMLFSRGSSQARDWTQVSLIARGFFTVWATREAQVQGIKRLLSEKTKVLDLFLALYSWAHLFTRTSSVINKNHLCDLLKKHNFMNPTLGLLNPYYSRRKTQ